VKVQSRMVLAPIGIPFAEKIPYQTEIKWQELREKAGVLGLVPVASPSNLP
jgi:hypothetical protein